MEKRIKLVQEFAAIEADLLKRMATEFHLMADQTDKKMEEISIIERDVSILEGESE